MAEISLAEKIAEKARKSISMFCMEECRSYCCRKGYLALSKEEMELVAQGRQKELEEKKVLRRINSKSYSLYLGDYGVLCPCIDSEYKCIIHKHPKRPMACQQFPLFIDGKNVRVSSRCLAAKEGKLYPYVSRLVRMGYRLSGTNAFADFEFEKVGKMMRV